MFFCGISVIFPFISPLSSSSPVEKTYLKFGIELFSVISEIEPGK